MGVRFPSVQSNTFIGPLPANATETIVCTTPPLTLPLDFSSVFVFAYFSYTVGTGSNGSAFNIRRGATVASPIISPASPAHFVTAGQGDFATFYYFDIPGAAAGVQYTLTIQQQGATAAGVFRDVAMFAFAL